MSSTSISIKSDPQLKITATLKDSAGNPLPNKTINFYKSTDNVNWTKIGTQTTDENGQASIYDALPSTTTYYKAEFPGDDQYEPSSAETSYTPATTTTTKKTEIPWWIILLLLLLFLFR